MYRLNVVLCFLFYIPFLCRGEAFQGVITCEDEDDCKYFINATCVKPTCMCEGTNICTESNVGTVVSKIGMECSSDQDCNIEKSQCLNGKCACRDGYVTSTNNRKCLRVSNGVGDSCEDSVQCYTKIQLSVCRHSKCVCEGMHEVNGTCYPNVELGGACQVNQECALNKFSTCKNSLCTCNDGYVAVLNNSACMKVADGNNSACIDDLQCTASLGSYSHCLDSFCRCKEMYHYKEKINKCVEDKMYGEICTVHSDCHEPFHEKESRLECIEGECKCRSFYKEKNGICIDPSSAARVTITFYSLFIVYVIKLLLI